MFEKTKKLNYKSTKDSLVIGLFEREYQRVNELDDILDGHLRKKIKGGYISTELGAITILHPTTIPAHSIIIVGLGKSKNITTEGYRKAFSNLAKSIKHNTTFVLDTMVSNIAIGEIASLLAETIITTTYQFLDLKSGGLKSELPKLKYTSSTDIKGELHKGYVIGTAVNNAKTLVNKPHSHLNAIDLAHYATALADALELEIQVIEKDKLEELGMTAYLSVNKGSHIPPKFILLKYQGKDVWEKPITLVGKGVTFDTGGYQIKPKASMLTMKSDMGGAAAVLGAIEAIAHLKLKENVLVAIPATDNMINEKAYVPDDVIVAANGSTIQISSTDAEGRLTLCDAIWYVQEKENASLIVDVATLTGGIVVALGSAYTGAFTNHEATLKKFMKASNEVDEPIWHMPIGKHFEDAVRNQPGLVADLDNVGNRGGHASSAAAFLQSFVNPKTKWIHLDIAGTAMTSGKMATGVMVRALVQFVNNNQKN